jgi:nicotinamidase-related amidase
MSTALVLVDIQNDYFPGGSMELEGALSASETAGRLLGAARENRTPVFHIQHIAAQPGATFFLPETVGAEIHAGVAPRAGEIRIVKHFPNAFRDTELAAELGKLNIKRLVLAGMMSHMCVDATCRAAFDLGYECLTAHDACATRALEWNGRKVAAADVHASFMSALAAVYARVLAADEIIRDWPRP